MEQVEAIKKYYPDFEIETIQFLNAGYDSEAYLINEQFVFKFPRHAIAAKNLYKEAHILIEIGDQLPIKVPTVHFLGVSENDRQMAFVGYERILGEPLTTEIVQSLSDEVLAALAKEIAAFFKALHAIKVDQLDKSLKLTKRDKCLKEFEVIESVVFPIVSEEMKEKINTIYKRILANDFQDTTCLVHNDFGASNIFFDTETNKICGIIDFGDIAIYDRDIDFVCLLQGQEEGFDQKFVDKVLAYYGYNDFEILEKKNDFNMFYAQLENVVLGYSYKMDELFEESLASLRQGISDYEKNILIEHNYRYYI